MGLRSERETNRIRRFLAGALLLLLPILGQCSHEPIPGENGPWRHRLYTPTFAANLGGVWFLVDTYHHRILYSATPDPDLQKWHTLTENIGGPHSVATDGKIVVYDDTGYGNLRAARYFNIETFLIDGTEGGNAEEYEIVFDVGTRPHRVIYDEAMESFYAISSLSQEILRVTNENGSLTVRHRERLSFLNGAYTRSMSIIDDHMFFVTRGLGIIEATYKDDQFEFVRSYKMPPAFQDLNDVFRSEAGWYYLTATYTGFGRAKSLEDFTNGTYEDLYTELNMRGVPYYMSEHKGTLYLPNTEASGVISFKDSEMGPITDIQILFEFGPPEPADEWRKDQHPR